MKKKGEVNILGIIDSSGGSLHRIKLPLSYLHGKVVKVNGEDCIIKTNIKELPIGAKLVEESFLENYDIVFSHWLLENSPGQMSYFCSKHQCKLVTDIDDFIDENSYEYHPLYADKQTSTFVKQVVLLTTACSDLVTVSTKPIITKLNEFAEAIQLSPNYLPFNENQFLVGENEPSDKMRILVIGSSSHFPDYKKYKGIIKKINDDSFIHQRAKWVIAGAVLGEVDQNGKPIRKWEEFISQFATNPKMEVEVLSARPVDNYMSLYRHGDICFQPISDNSFNECKSALRLSECATRYIPVIGSDLYQTKELNGYCKASTPKDVYNWIRYFIKNKNWIEVGKDLANKNIKDSKFESRIEHLRLAFEWVLNYKREKPKNLTIYGIKYDESQYTEYTEVLNTNTTKLHRFEYGVMLDKLEEIKSLDRDQWIGFFSHKFSLKTNLSSKLLNKLFNENVSLCNVMSFSLRYWKTTKDYLDFSNAQHPRLEEFTIKLCNKLGIKYTIEGDFVTYSNFHLMKRDTWIDYIENCIIPGLKYLENDIWDEVNIDAKYNGGLTKEELKEKTGLEFYNYITFIMERMIIQYVYHNKLNYKQIL